MTPYRIAMLQGEFGTRHECHSYHFGPFMDECEPRVLKEVWPSAYQYHTDLGHPDEFVNVQREPGFEIATVWDVQSVERAEKFASFVRRRPCVCRTLEDALEGVDAVFLADGGGTGQEHVAWVTPILQRRLPVYVDKPLAATYADAKALTDLAQQMDTPLFSASILRYVSEVETFRAQWQRIPDPGLAVVKGVGPANGAVIHGLALMQGLFGLGVEWVECVGDLPCEIMHVHYRSGLQVVVLNTAYGVFDWFRCEVWGRTRRTNPPRRLYAQSEPIGDAEYLPASLAIVRRFKQMIATRQPPEPYDVPVELIAVFEAGHRAHQTRQRVFLSEIVASPEAVVT